MFFVNSEIFEKVKKIIVDKFDIEEDKIIFEFFFLDDFGVDLLDIVEFIMEFEEEFGIEILDEDVEKIRIVVDVVKYIEEY